MTKMALKSRNASVRRERNGVGVHGERGRRKRRRSTGLDLDLGTGDDIALAPRAEKGEGQGVGLVIGNQRNLGERSPLNSGMSLPLDSST